MARRSSAAGLGIGVLIILGLIASVPKEVWIGMAVLAGIGFILYFFLKGQSQRDGTAQVPSVDTRAPVPAPRHVADDVDRSVTSVSCWVKPGTEITAKGLTIPGGMLYYGKGLARVTGSGIEPALINPGLPVNIPTGPVEQMPYWPSYSDISPTARGGYLQWLAGGRKDPNIQIGYVFLFFYGLERRVLADSRQYPEVAQELPAVLVEVRRLLSIYGNQSSFYGYASRFVDLVVRGTSDSAKLQP